MKGYLRERERERDVIASKGIEIFVKSFDRWCNFKLGLLGIYVRDFLQRLKTRIQMCVYKF